MTAKLMLAMPSKGRLLEAAEARFRRAGLVVMREGLERGYQGRVAELPDIEVTFLSAIEIAQGLKDGSVALGVTGEDLLREAMPEGENGVAILLRLGFGHADVVVAVPQSWLDVATMADLDEVAVVFHARHGRRLKIATKYPGLTRRWFAEKGVTGYRIVESAGATEGAPASGTAEAIVDITTTGSTLRANRLKVLDDGVILRSEAVLAGRAEALGHPAVALLKARMANSEKEEGNRQ
jgi:ATP phosphoribosyltransferase